ncbi:hypothetical protein MAPG_11586 [Magnaporthiopsis poae ATCC 64411]|uniref:Uncharacterized protein n=1 Tax=Magnaporthiopsis poae (strain ATCC 64411 / 73-15) TaxID=644358 RepID=A0A0C4EFN4_MAGP6|nr:hypothetical protein MAPG_11586 [Magnaporthiopsis poae ATCC 64411]
MLMSVAVATFVAIAVSVAVTTLLRLLKEAASLGPSDDPVVLYAAMLRVKVDLGASLAGTWINHLRRDRRYVVPPSGRDLAPGANMAPKPSHLHVRLASVNYQYAVGTDDRYFGCCQSDGFKCQTTTGCVPATAAPAPSGD